ncbi:hypothetical protein [Deinococcus sp.]|uniref:hypothetical protein n=1 Tax=Deinococcus sp. TaxID=47478 RepID=UPI0025F7B5A7|nr:hypothetical protein [Deinococcus sp.]
MKNKVLPLVLIAALLPSCAASTSQAAGLSLSQIAARSTPTINALLEAGRRGDIQAALATFVPGKGSEAALKTLFATRKEVFARFSPLRAADSSYSSVQGGSFFDDLFRGGTQLEARVPGVDGVSLRAKVVNRGGWKLTAFEFYSTP